MSFSDILKEKSLSANANSGIAVATMSLDETENSIAAYSGDDFVKSDKYLWYDEYYDDEYSTVDKQKNISLNKNQINLTQEENSQVIPFMLDRYYDGIDLTKMLFQIHFVNENGDESTCTPINLQYNSEKIRFYFLVPSEATAIAGILEFEIIAIGTNEKGDTYRWRTKPNSDLKVLKSLAGNGVIEPSEGWDTYLELINQKVLQAQNAADEAKTAAAEAVQASTSVDTKIANASSAIKTQVVDEMSEELDKFYTKEETDTLLENIDISDQLEEIESRVADVESTLETFQSDPTAEWVAAYDAKMDEKISAATSAVQTDLDEYKAQTDADLQSIHENIDNLPSTLESDYYTKEQVDSLIDGVASSEAMTELTTKVASIESTANNNKSDISTISTKVAELDTELSSIDKSPRLTYDVSYNDTEDPDVGENVFAFYEIQNEGQESEVREIKQKFTIVGGSGGSGTSSSLKLEYVTKTPLVVTVDDKALLTFRFSGTDSSGDDVLEAQAIWKVAGTVVATSTVVNGENTFDITNFISIGTQKVLLSVTDDAGSLVTKTWNVQKIDVRLESTFDDTFTYPIEPVSFTYTPYGAIEKNVHFILDGTEIGTVTTSVSGVPMSYTLPTQQHGSHLLEVYMTAILNNNTIESNHIYKDILWYNSTSPVIGCVQQEFTARQHDTTNLIFTVYDPTTETPEVTLAVDGVVVSTLVLDSYTQTWQYKSTEVGEHILTITCRDTVKTLKATIEKLDIDVSPVTANLVFDFNPVGKTNNDSDRLWTDGTTSMTVSENFDWVNGGYQIDEDGDQYFCIKAGTSAVIDNKLFADDAKKTGKEFKLIFKTTNVQSADATFLTCIDGTDDSKIGIQMNVHEAYVCASAGSLYLPYCENRIIEFEFNIAKNTDSIPSIRGFEDGRGTWGLPYSDSHDFTQINPQYITIGSPYCDVHIYRFKTYNAGLSDSAILNNFIADARTADEMIDRYNRNQIYDENNQLTKEHLAKICPHLRIVGLEAPYFTNNKSDKVDNTTIYYTYKNGDPILDNWTCYNSQHSGQGTTSNEYGQSSRNLDLIMNTDSSYFVLGDGTTQVSEISLTRTSVPVAYLNVKVNVASQDNANNKCLAYLYNKFQPYQRPAKTNNEYVKDTMEFYNCVVFIRETDPDTSTHREFDDCEWHYYSFGNIGDSKKTDSTRLNDPDDPLEHIIEIMDNTFPNSIFPTGVVDDDGKPVYPISSDQWVPGNTAYDTLYADPFDESMTYGWRYCYNKKDSAVTTPCMEAWRNFYTFVVTSSDEEFKANLKDYFVVDTALFYYLFTHFFTMIDNRAKNSFWHYGKCEDGVYRYDLCFGYDFDSALGINNSGELTMSFGYEDIDYKTKGDASTGYAYNGALSVFFCRIRDLFVDELNDMYVNRESAGCWNKTTISNLFNESQNEYPEALWMVDDYRKYQRTFIEGAPRYYNTMMSGPKKWQREGFLDGQEPYMASKHYGNTAVSDQIMFRCNTPTENVVVKPDYTLHLTPYVDMYLSVMFGATYKTQIRAEAGKEYDIECPFTTMDDTAVLIYCASQIQAIGDLSPCYIHDNEFGKAIRLKILMIGSDIEGYQNNFLTNLGIGNNALLEKLDIQNTPNLSQAIDLSGCPNLKELYAHGSGLTGVTFANGGQIEIAELPAINAMTMRNLLYLTDLDIVSFNKLTTITIENCSTIDVKAIFEKAPNLNRVRVTGIDWSLDDTTLLEEIYAMAGIDKNGYNITQSVLAGKVHVPVIRQQQLYDYLEAWSDLEITFDTMIEQFAVTFVNDDGSVLEVQYVDKGGDATDPTTRTENPLTPTKKSTVSHDFTFAGWDSVLTSVFSDRTITATYTESLRSYTVKYVSKGITMQESTDLYGNLVPYTGTDPVYTLEESGYVYHLFNRWDKSGIVDGDKTINAIFDRCEYTEGYFDGKELSDLTPVEIYAMTKLGLETSVIQDMDKVSFTVGKDYDYDDIESQLIISEKTSFNGSQHIDTGIKLFDEDRDFVLAIDYEFLSGTESGSVLAQCFQSNGSNGFKLWYNSGSKITWGTASNDVGQLNYREMAIIRHKKGENNLWFYNSNLSDDEPISLELTRSKTTSADSTLVFGSAKADDGLFENYAIGNIYWCKLWYMDLGDDICKELVGWTHENITFNACGFKRYYLSDNPSKRCSFSLLATHLLERDRKLTSVQSNAGGWAAMQLNTLLNKRLYSAFPTQWKSLVKQVTVSSSIGSKSTEISTSECYITIPSCIEVDSTMSTEPYVYEGSAISYMTTNDMRKRAYDGGDYHSYWLRSPNASYANYMYQVDESGNLYGYHYPNYASGILIEVSI